MYLSDFGIIGISVNYNLSKLVRMIPEMATPLIKGTPYND